MEIRSFYPISTHFHPLAPFLLTSWFRGAPARQPYKNLTISQVFLVPSCPKSGKYGILQIFAEFTLFVDILRFGAPKAKNVASSFWHKNTPHQTLCLIRFLGQPHHFRGWAPFFHFVHFWSQNAPFSLKYTILWFWTPKTQNECFCDLDRKYPPKTVTFTSFWTTFPRA